MACIKTKATKGWENDEEDGPEKSPGFGMGQGAEREPRCSAERRM